LRNPLFRKSTYPSSSEQIVYFIVTNVDCNPPSTNTALGPSDIHLGLSAGELGCWVDATVTRVTQTGIEHARIPDASAYLSARLDLTQSSGSNFSYKDPRSTLGSGVDATAEAREGNHRAFVQLLGLAQAALMPNALTFDIPVSMLLKGSRGIGKFTTAVKVARRLGMHVFEVGSSDVSWVVLIHIRRTVMTFSGRTTRKRRDYSVLASNKRLHVRPVYL